MAERLPVYAAEIDFDKPTKVLVVVVVEHEDKLSEEELDEELEAQLVLVPSTMIDFFFWVGGSFWVFLSYRKKKRSIFRFSTRTISN